MIKSEKLRERYTSVAVHLCSLSLFPGVFGYFSGLIAVIGAAGKGDSVLGSSFDVYLYVKQVITWLSGGWWGEDVSPIPVRGMRINLLHIGYLGLAEIWGEDPCWVQNARFWSFLYLWRHDTCWVDDSWDRPVKFSPLLLLLLHLGYLWKIGEFQLQFVVNGVLFARQFTNIRVEVVWKLWVFAGHRASRLWITHTVHRICRLKLFFSRLIIIHNFPKLLLFSDHSPIL